MIETDDKNFRLLRDELFGPIVTTYVYDEKRWDDTLKLVDESAPYGLTGAVFATERAAIEEAEDALRYAAGNFYVNDKPTGAVVGQQPFGGSRASGTNDKAGSMWNLIRWVSPRTIKETFVSATDYRYPFLGPDGKPEFSLQPTGSAKLSYINGLYASGIRRNPRRSYNNYPLYLIGWHAGATRKSLTMPIRCSGASSTA